MYDCEEKFNQIKFTNFNPYIYLSSFVYTNIKNKSN